MLYTACAIIPSPVNPKSPFRASPTESVLVRIRQSVNPRTGVLEEFSHLFGCGISLGDVHALPDSTALVDFFLPFLQGGPFGQIDLQCDRATANPRIVGDISNGIFRARQITTLLQTGLQNGVQSLRLADVAVNPIVGTSASEQPEMIGLAYMHQRK